jgi:Thiamine pyrophosphate enzyme, central domain
LDQEKPPLAREVRLKFDFEPLTEEVCYKLMLATVLPRPIAWVTSQDRNGAVNAAHTSRAKDFLEYNNPYDVGMTGVFGIGSGYQALMECDTLLLLGCDFAWRQFYPGKAKIIQIDIAGNHLGRRYPIDIGAVGDVKATVEALLPHIKPRGDRAFLEDALERRKKAIAHLDRRATVGKGGAIHPEYLARLIAKHAERDAIFTADAGLQDVCDEEVDVLETLRHRAQLAVVASSEQLAGKGNCREKGTKGARATAPSPCRPRCSLSCGRTSYGRRKNSSA